MVETRTTESHKKEEHSLRINAFPVWAQQVIALVKEAGAIGLAIMVVGFYMAQQAGWIGNVDRLEHRELIIETQRQTTILKDNQRIISEMVTQSRDNHEAFVQLARGICISVTKTSDIERRCLGSER